MKNKIMTFGIVLASAMAFVGSIYVAFPSHTLMQFIIIWAGRILADQIFEFAVKVHGALD